MKNVFSAVFAILFLCLFSTQASAATFTVTKTADTNDGTCDADCSLREAIAEANTAQSDDVIEFSSLFDDFQIITLGGTELTIANNGTLAINGPNLNHFILTANDQSRVFFIESGATVTLFGMTIRNGRSASDGGNIYNDDGNLLVQFSAITTGSTQNTGKGAGIYNNSGVVIIENADLRANQASGEGGAIFSVDDGSGTSDLMISDTIIHSNTAVGRGGAISTSTELDIFNVTFLASAVTGSPGYGGAIYTNVDVTINSGGFNGCDASQRGGGIYNDGATITLTQAAFIGCQAVDGGAVYTTGDFTHTEGRIMGNASGRGGAVYKAAGQLNLSSILFAGTAGIAGGALYNLQEDADLFEITTSSGSAPNGGGLYLESGTLQLDRSFIQSTSGDDGGAVYVKTGTATITNSTFLANFVNGSGGVAYVDTGGGLDIFSSTLTFNRADENNDGTGDGGAINNTQGGTVNARNNILANNTVNSGSGPDYFGIINSLGYNLIEDPSGSSGTVATDVLGQDPLLEPLGFYGGRTLTFPLGNGSPAIDAADPVNFPAIDQRGFPRPIDGDLNGSSLPDIGAVERTFDEFIVTKNTDTNDGTCDADCSFREAVVAANASISLNRLINFDPAVFSSQQTILLDAGTISFTNTIGSVAVSGTGRNMLTVEVPVSGNSFSVSNNAVVQILGMKVTSSNNNGGAIFNQGALTLNDIAIENAGSLALNNNGGNLKFTNGVIRNNVGRGAFNSGGELEITDSEVSGNSDTGITNNRGTVVIRNTLISSNITVAGVGAGGGVKNIEGTMTIENSTITGNETIGSNGDGGGINNFSFSGSFPAVLDLVDSTVSDNIAGNSGADGGGIRNRSAEINITRSSIIKNDSRSGHGGGIYSESGTVNIENSTISGNKSALNGGGVYNNATADLTNVTIADNFADSDGNTSGTGGGVFNSTGSTLNSRNSIFARNRAGLNVSDFSGTLSSGGYNLVGSTNATTISGVTTGNLLDINAGILPLGNYGGPTRTHALLSSSPAVDTADPSNIPATDQRGITRPLDGTFDTSAIPDMGAYERNAQLHVVTKVADTNDGVCDSDCSLREAIATSNTNAGTIDDVIRFDIGAFAGIQTIVLTAPLSISSTGSVAIEGPGQNNLTVSGANSVRVIETVADAVLEINGFTIANGNTPQNGAGVRSLGLLAALNMSFTQNNASAGSAIESTGSFLAVESSMFNNNTSTVTNGGTLRTESQTASVAASTFFENQGGGISNLFQGNLSVDSTLINGNDLLPGGTGIFNLETITVSGSEIVGNKTGIDTQFGNLTITDSKIRDNFDGGFLHFNGGNSSIISTTISGNVNPSAGLGTGGGGILIGGATTALTISNSTVSGNSTQGQGGGAAVFGGSLTSINTTFSGNSATNSISQESSGGAILNSGGTVTLRSSTIASNSALSGGGGLRTRDAGLTVIRNTIIGDNTAPVSPDVEGDVTSQGYNLIEDNAGTTINGNTIGNILGADPQLRPLGNNGGDTRTHALNPNSPAVDGGNSFGLTTDQRLAPRPVDDPDRTNGPGGDGTDIGAFERQLTKLFSMTLFDFDGDDKADVSIFRPGPGEWWYQRSSDSLVTALQFGSSTDIPVPADFTGDGVTDIAFFRPSTGEWFVLRSEDQSFFAFNFGANGDQPAPGDFDGDGVDDPAVFRASIGQWFVLRSSDGNAQVIPFGIAGDKALVGDYDGDGVSDVGVFRSSLSEYWLLRSTGGLIAYQFGQTGDQAFAADFTGDGTDDAGFFRPATGEWFILRSEDQSFFAFPFGATGDIPAPADYDGDGTADPTVFRPSTATWFSAQTTSGTVITPFGANGDRPAANSYVVE